MKVKILTIIFFLIVLLTPGVSAQGPENYNDAFTQYKDTVEEYNTAHDEYILRRSQYLRFKTLQSENDARAATVAMLQKRDDVVLTYLLTLRKKVEETKGMTDAEKASQYVLLDAETSFFQDHKTKIPSAGTLKDLENDSKLAETRYTKTASSTFYQTLFYISNGKVTDLETRLTEQLSNLKNKIEAIRVETRPEYMFSFEKFQSIDRFVFESDNKLIRADERQLAALDLQKVREFTNQEYTNRLRTLGEVQQLLKETSGYLKETINQIKKQ